MLGKDQHVIPEPFRSPCARSRRIRGCRERGVIGSTVSRVISLEEIPQALATLAEGHVRGKIVAQIKTAA